jgi:glutamine amidotransferase
MMAITEFDFNKHKDVIENFFKLSTEGKVPPKNAPGHLDGWGIGWYKNGKANIIKSGNSVVKEKKRFFDSLRKVGKSKILMVHFRKAAWDKSSKEKHAHPFVFDNFIFSHNGTIFDYHKLLPLIPGKNLPEDGALDTEVFFRYLANGFPSNFRKSINYIIKNNKYSSLSFLMSGEDKLYAYRNFSKWENYYTLYKTNICGSVIISSQPVLPSASWKLIGTDKLTVVKAV